MAGDRFTYEYDFGDSWTHAVVVESLERNVEPLKHAVCLEGARACPPEDCGGFPGFERLCDALADPNDDEHDGLSEWVVPTTRRSSISFRRTLRYNECADLSSESSPTAIRGRELLLIFISLFRPETAIHQNARMADHTDADSGIDSLSQFISWASANPGVAGPAHQSPVRSSGLS